MINKDILNEFYDLTKFDIISYYTDFSNFMKTDYNNLYNYFNGNTEVINPAAFNKLDFLLQQSVNLFSLYNQVKDNLNNYKWWDLLEQLEEIHSSLLTIKSLSKWLRSPKTNYSYNQKTELQITLDQNQTLERLNSERLNEIDSQNSWYNTAIRNNLKEEDYSIEGGNLLTVSFNLTGSIFINAVVDNITGEKVLGIDIDKKFTFENNDIKVLTYSDTFKQSVLILSSLKKGDNPYLPNDGIDTKSVIGTNINLVNYPSIVRQMSNAFATDDTIKSFAIIDIKRESDAIYAKFEARSRISDLHNFKIKLSN